MGENHRGYDELNRKQRERREKREEEKKNAESGI